MAKKKVLRIVSKRDGYRRCGVRHPDTPVDHPLDRFTKQERAILETDPMLLATEVEVGADDEKTGGDDPKPGGAKGAQTGGGKTAGKG